MTPRTAAGRALLHDLNAEAVSVGEGGDAILAIEAEADRSLLLDAALRALVEAWDGFDPATPAGAQQISVVVEEARAALAATDVRGALAEETVSAASGWHPSFYEGHEPDGNGGCIRCRFWVVGTDDEHTILPYPCPWALAAKGVEG